jgi:hypothetical protein
MVNSNFSPQDKKPGDLILSADWNAAMTEIKRLEKAKINREGADTLKGPLTIQEALNVTGDVKISGNLQLDAGREIIFADNGQIRSVDNNHRILFRRSENKLELREFGDIVFSPGATTGNETAKVVLQSNGSLGIGINPGYTLDVNGSVRLGGFTGNDVDEWPKVVWYRDTNAGWDEGLIKHSSTRGVFNRPGYGIHLDQSKQFGFFSTNWTSLFAVRGGTGDAYFRGNIGIGSNPAQDKLDVAGNLRILTNTNPIRFTSAWSGFPDALPNQAEIANDTGNYQTLMIVGNKSAGLGRRVSIWDRLEVHGNQTIQGNLELQSLKILDPSTPNNSMNIYFEHGNQTIVFYHQSGVGQFMRPDGKWNLNSDMCLKENILEINNILEKALQLRPVSFKWKSNGINDIGFIAQDVEEIFPNLVSSVHLSQQEDKEIKGLPYSHFGVIAIAAIKEMKKYYDSKIEIIEQKVSQLFPEDEV